MRSSREKTHSLSLAITKLLILITLSGFSPQASANQTLLPHKNPHLQTIYPKQTWDRRKSPQQLGYAPKKLKKVLQTLSSLNTTSFLATVKGWVLLEYGDISEVSYIASCRKSVLAMLYGHYAYKNKINLDRTLQELNITDIGGLLPLEQKATVRDLISARSGVYHAASNSGDHTKDAPERGSQKPGTYFLYNNWDFNAAGTIFEQMTGVSLYDALEKHIATPLQMQDFDRSRHKRSGDTTKSIHKAYHMYFSTRDMARLGHLMLNKGRWKRKVLFPQIWAKEMTSLITKRSEMNPPSMRDGEFGYGYMWWVWDTNDPDYQGAYTARGAFGQYISVFPKLHLVVAHKTKVPPYSKKTKWSEYRQALQQLISSRK